MSESLRDLFLLEQDVVFLNHGSFGACPKPVFEKYQEWQLRLERQPVHFFARVLRPALVETRSILAEYLGARTDCVVPVTNATFGVNVIAKSLKLEPGDEILSNEHEYGACVRAWQRVCEKTGAVYVSAPIPDPIESLEHIAEAIWSQVTDRTKVLFISHITSPSGIVFPAEELGRRARERGILVVVDGAHAPSQVPLDLANFPCDFYTGNCHKWLCAPKGTGFLFAQPDKKDLIEPLVVSWGNNNPDVPKDPYVDELQFFGTHDPSAFLTVPAAIEFQKEHDWDSVRARCQEMVRWVKDELESLPNVRPWYPTDSSMQKQMTSVKLPGKDGTEVYKYLMDEYKIEIPSFTLNGETVLRVSVQGYTTQRDLETLVEAVRRLG